MERPLNALSFQQKLIFLTGFFFVASGTIQSIFRLVKRNILRYFYFRSEHVHGNGLRRTGVPS